MKRIWLCSALFGALFAAAPAGAWDRGSVSNFATLPAFSPSGAPPNSAPCPGGKVTCTSDVEGIAVAPDGTVYAPSFGFNRGILGSNGVPTASGALGGNGEMFVISPTGQVVNHFPVLGSSPHLIGAIFQPSSQMVLVADLGLGVVWQVDPAGASTVFMTAPKVASSGPGLNAIAFDKQGNVYVSDSFQGIVWKTGPNGGKPTAWYAPTNKGQNDLLLPTANDAEPLVPPFGANGLAFNNEGTKLFVNNTAYHSIIEIPVNSDGSAGTGTVFTTGINAPDGMAIDAHDNLWVLANQGDEVIVVDPNGRVIAKKGDFNGINSKGQIEGLLFPASDAFSPDGSTLYITNLALYLPYAGVPEIAVDSAYTLQVKHYNIAQIPATLP